MTAWTYILECADRSFYVGCTTNLRQRLEEHHSGSFGGYTSERLPVRLVWSARHIDVRDAIAQERQLKGWSRAKKQALITGRLDCLPALSRRGFRPSFETPAGAGSSGG